MVEFTKEALDNLGEIRAHIALEYPERANRIAAEITARCQMLDKHPMIGRPGIEPGTRELSTAKPWVVVYEVVDGRVNVLRVWHSRQSRKL